MNVYTEKALAYIYIFLNLNFRPYNILSVRVPDSKILTDFLNVKYRNLGNIYIAFKEITKLINVK